MAKMGISVISSYRGGLNFEAVGLSRAMCAEYFPGLMSRISGIGVSGIQKKSVEIHNAGWLADGILPIGVSINHVKLAKPMRGKHRQCT